MERGRHLLANLTLVSGLLNGDEKLMLDCSDLGTNSGKFSVGVNKLQN